MSVVLSGHNIPVWKEKKMEQSWMNFFNTWNQLGPGKTSYNYNSLGEWGLNNNNNNIKI